MSEEKSSKFLLWATSRSSFGTNRR